ncbi:zinc ABC transporter ATP-binding protein ZnuC [Testudinibacter aquarius]|uniref:Zinc ABC transporter ATP-binding protein ZnuC n=1 Tax=Testudinibacter aquarius TaxID=1524974 RepID=A0A4R3Y7Q9_9PAST|nr:zinc ABC transporter ATP-binding protein ZnuC [Testudinibacter aquarius]KAE9525534.1 zinc ABC transporter ATP-binding protein ZnuC [Testudinibacter aquarius]TCV87886.1 zinc transport system ATP-binding protein [Testudinibacter aquarius]TNG88644.1 zinc ABC transporter ATP-binding protein ZnuC [Testudinibacter aquarius]
MNNNKPQALIELKDIGVRFNNKIVLNNINLKLYPNSVTTIVGPNGGGKSTLLKVLLKLIRPTQGAVKAKTKLRIGYVPQKIHLDQTLPLTVKKFLSLQQPQSTKIDEILLQLSIQHLTEQSMHKLSGGEMQRVLLARALLNQPELLVLDEPVQGVDIGGQAELYQLIAESKNRLNCAVLMVSHDLHLVMANTDHVLCINQHLCCAGTPETVSEHPDFIRYFGDQFAQNFALYTHHHNHKHNLHGDVCCGAHANAAADCHHTHR